jgi:eukaryotic-like serine/threonine-protein kinase
MTDAEIFAEALERTDPTDRDAYLAAACGSDRELHLRMRELLFAHAQTGEFLNRPALAGDADTERTWNNGKPPSEEEIALTFLKPSRRVDSLGRIGHYEVLEILGRGGFGIVFRAFDDVLQRVVAVKVLSPQLATNSPARKRFLREARAAAPIRHDHVVQVYGIEDEPLPYLVMEFIPGKTLQQLIDETGPMEVPQVIRFGIQIARGLAAAHAVGMIHRDIKPANILIEDGIEPRVKISDFGLARAADDASLSHSGLIAGTPMFMAPEQAYGEALDHRTDLFSLGSVLYTMCTGRPPFRAENSLAVLKRVAEDTPRPVQQIIPEVPTWLCEVIARLHEKNPEDRIPTAAQVVEHLSRPESVVVAARTAPRSQRTRRRTRIAVAIALTLFVAAATTGLVLAVKDRNPKQVPNGVGDPGDSRPIATPVGDRFANAIGIRFVRVPRGIGWLQGFNGNEGKRSIDVPRDFYLGQYEITQAEWSALISENPSHFQRQGTRHNDIRDLSDEQVRALPVDSVSWEQCCEYLRLLNERAPIPGWVYRLPTTQEWEYACRGGPVAKADSAFDFYFETPTNAVGNNANLKGTGPGRTLSGGTYPPNRLGLYDMHGNVFEYCDDFRKRDGDPLVVLRGGSWHDEVSMGAAGNTNIGTPSANYNGGGLRVALVPVAGR